jgi:hypothetical protein
MTQVKMIALILLIVVIGLGSFAFSIHKCGPKALLMGNGSFAVAASGMCD